MTNEMDIIIKEAQKGDFKIRVKFEYTDRKFGKKTINVLKQIRYYNL